MTKRLILVETLVRNVWTRHDLWTTAVDCEPEDMAHRACQIMAALVADWNWPGTKARARWDEGGGEIVMMSNDPLLDDYILAALLEQRSYAESQRRIFRRA